MTTKFNLRSSATCLPFSLGLPRIGCSEFLAPLPSLVDPPLQFYAGPVPLLGALYMAFIFLILALLGDWESRLLVSTTTAKQLTINFVRLGTPCSKLRFSVVVHQYCASWNGTSMMFMVNKANLTAWSGSS